MDDLLDMVWMHVQPVVDCARPMAEGKFAWSPDGAYLAVYGRDGVWLFDVLLDVWSRYRPAATCVSLTWDPAGPRHEPTVSARHR
jgi:hypothetical protein